MTLIEKCCSHYDAPLVIGCSAADVKMLAIKNQQNTQKQKYHIYCFHPYTDMSVNIFHYFKYKQLLL